MFAIYTCDSVIQSRKRLCLLACFTEIYMYASPHKPRNKTDGGTGE